MKSSIAFDQVFQRVRRNSQALWYVSTQLAAKATAAIAQIYTIYVFSKILSPNDAALIFILFGYGIWIQVFEFGLSQVIQNSLNSRQITVSGACPIIGLHYLLMIFLAALVIMFPEASELLRGNRRVQAYDTNSLAFPFGIGLLLVSTSNVLVQRLLLVINRALLASKLQFVQGLFCILTLLVLQWRGANFIESVSIYLSVPIIIFFPTLLIISKKGLRNRRKPPINLTCSP
jgi:hypothetical protein